MINGLIVCGAHLQGDGITVGLVGEMDAWERLRGMEMEVMVFPLSDPNGDIYIVMGHYEIQLMEFVDKHFIMDAFTIMLESVVAETGEISFFAPNGISMDDLLSGFAGTD